MAEKKGTQGVSSSKDAAMAGKKERGRVSISKDVVTVIAGIAVSEVEGIANIRPGEGDFRRGEEMKRYVNTEVEGDNVRVAVQIAVYYGKPIHKVAKQVQTRVKSEIERMTGLKVNAVDVDVQRLVEPEEQGTTEEGA